MRAFFMICLTVAVVALTGCAAQTQAVSVPNLPHAMPVSPPPGSYMLTANTHAGDALHSMLLLRMGSGGGILTTTLVNLDDFEETSAFGRVAAQQVGSRLGQYGYRVLESRLATSLSMERRTGEFMLTRDACKLLADTYDASAVLVGCYSDTGSTVFVSVRVVRLSDSAIMGAYEYYLPRDSDVTHLMAGPGRAGSTGSATWTQYNRREQAFSSRVNTVATQPSDAGMRPVMPGAVQKDMPMGGGRYIDPAAPPMPFPGKRKK